MSDDIVTGTAIPDTDQSLPPPVNETPPDVNPFAGDEGGPVLTQAPTPLMERMRLHFKKSNVTGSLGGSLSHYGDTAIERGALARGFNPSDLENENIDRA